MKHLQRPSMVINGYSWQFAEAKAYVTVNMSRVSKYKYIIQARVYHLVPFLLELMDTSIDAHL